MDREQAIRLMQDLLRRMVEMKGSDLFITAGFPPPIKIDGEIRHQTDRALAPEAAAVLVRAHHERPPDARVRRYQGVQLRDRSTGHRALSRQRLRAAEHDRLRDPHDQRQDPDTRGPRTRADPAGRDPVQARPGHRRRRHGLRQVDHACGDGRPPQREHPRPHRHHRGPGRVRARAQGLRDHPSRGRRRHRQLASRR